MELEELIVEIVIGLFLLFTSYYMVIIIHNLTLKIKRCLQKK